jgi:hypothetical protein
MEKEVVTVGLDLAKNVFQVHAVPRQHQWHRFEVVI